MLPLPLLHFANTPAVSGVVAAGKFKVATPDVSAVFISTIQETVVLFGGQNI
jgi:hypothetical protein